MQHAAGKKPNKKQLDHLKKDPILHSPPTPQKMVDTVSLKKHHAPPLLLLQNIQHLPIFWDIFREPTLDKHPG